MRTQRSEALREFSFLDLCFNMDLNYGLKDAHRMDNGFLSWFMEVDGGALYEMYMDEDPYKSTKAINLLTMRYLGDLHSSFNGPSLYCPDYSDDTEYNVPEEEQSPSNQNYMKNAKAKNEVRKDVFGENTDHTVMLPGIQIWGECGGYIVPVDLSSAASVEDIVNAMVTKGFEGGVSVFVSFDNFRDYRRNYGNHDYGNPRFVPNGGLTAEEINNILCNYNKSGIDTLGLVWLANEVIHEYDSYCVAHGTPAVENVILDLSINGGGAVNAEAFVDSWLLGETEFSLRNPSSGAFFTYYTEADVNMDGTIDAKDNVSDKRIFAITSSNSFSCGNLLPSQLFHSGRAVLIGSQSGGGACAVLPTSTADGIRFQTSSTFHFCVEVNGYYRSVEDGAPVLIPCTTPASYYNRANIVNVIRTAAL